MSTGCGCKGDKCRLRPDDSRHGTENGYTNQRCRCDECRSAHADYYRDGPGGDAVRRYRARLNDQGLTPHGEQRQVAYQAHPKARGKRTPNERKKT